MIDRKVEYELMAAAEDKLWWYRSLHNLAWRAVRKHQPDKNAFIVDAGCGTGGMMDFLKRKGYKNLKGLDLSPDALAVCKSKSLDVVQANIADITDHFQQKSADVIISNDVLCYFELNEMQQVTNGFWEVLKPRGLLIMNLPSLKAYSGVHDISVGIKYRCSLRDLWVINDHSRYDCLSRFYWPFFLSPMIYMIRLSQRGMMKKPGFEIKSDLDMTPNWVNEILYNFTELENRILSAKPTGSSLFMVLRKR